MTDTHINSHQRTDYKTLLGKKKPRQIKYESYLRFHGTITDRLIFLDFSFFHPIGNKRWKTQYIEINKTNIKTNSFIISPQHCCGVGYVGSWVHIAICLSVSLEMIGYANPNSSVTVRRVVTLSLTTLRMERWNQFWQPNLISTPADLHNTRHVNQPQMWQGN